MAFDRSGQRLIDWECGNRDAATLNRLLERLKPWSVTLYCTDDYAPYDTLLPVGRHYIGKDETVAIERVNSRLRHWFARFRRRTCVVSKALEMVDATIALFAAYHVNRTAAKLTLPLPARLGEASGHSARKPVAQEHRFQEFELGRGSCLAVQKTAVN